MIELTEREHTILRGLAAGLTIVQIAARYGRSTKTIEAAALRLRRKLGVATSAQAIDRAWRLGLLGYSNPMLPHERPLPSVRRPPAGHEEIERRRAVLLGKDCG